MGCYGSLRCICAGSREEADAIREGLAEKIGNDVLEMAGIDRLGAGEWLLQEGVPYNGDRMESLVDAIAEKLDGKGALLAYMSNDNTDPCVALIWNFGDGTRTAMLENGMGEPTEIAIIGDVPALTGEMMAYLEECFETNIRHHVSEGTGLVICDRPEVHERELQEAGKLGIPVASGREALFLLGVDVGYALVEGCLQLAPPSSLIDLADMAGFKAIVRYMQEKCGIVLTDKEKATIDACIEEPPREASKNAEQNYIRGRLGDAAMYESLAKKCTELAKAALKKARIIRGVVPTPVTAEEADAAVKTGRMMERLLGGCGRIGPGNGAKRNEKTMTEAEKVICRMYLEDLDEDHSCNEYHLLMKLIDDAPTPSPPELTPMLRCRQSAWGT